MRFLCFSLLFCLSCSNVEQQNDIPQTDVKIASQSDAAFSEFETRPEWNCKTLKYEAGKTVNLVGKLDYKKYEWSKTGSGWDDVDVNFFLFDDDGYRYHIVASETIPEERLHTFVGKKVKIKAVTFTQNGVAEGVYPVDKFGNPSLVRPMRFRVQEVSGLENPETGN